MQYQILPTNIIRIVWQTVRRITNEILEKKRVCSPYHPEGPSCWSGFLVA